MTSISAKAAAVLSAIENLKKCLEEPRRTSSTTVTIEALVDVSERFGLWTRNIGALHPPGSKLSLDSRLQNALEIQEWVCELLDDLMEALDDLSSILLGKAENCSLVLDEPGLEDLGDPEESAPHDEAQEIIRAAIECCRGLLKSSMLIRRATTRDRFNKALHKTENPFSDQFDINHVQEKYPKLSEPESKWLLSRLGRANTWRRQFLRYCREHQNSLEASQSLPEDNNAILSPPAEPVAALAEKKHLPSAPDRMSQTGFTDPGTKASTLNVIQLSGIRDEPEDDTLSYISAVRSDFAQENAVLELPSLRTVGKGQPEFECPLCHTIQSFKRESQWKRHAFADLKAYVCSLAPNECDLQLFKDSHSWFEHELQNHRCHWTCALCGSGSFRSIDMFQAHVKNSHPTLPDAEAALLDQGSRRVPDLLPAADCPFCTEWEDKIRADLEKQGADNTTVQPTYQDLSANIIVVERDKFRRHVASHMEQLALFAIPPVIEDSDNELDSNHAVMPQAEEDRNQPGRRPATPTEELDWQPDPPLHIAAFRGDLAEIKRLIVEGADVDATGETWGTTFTAAEMGGDASISELLQFYSLISNSLSPGDRLGRAEMQLITDALEAPGVESSRKPAPGREREKKGHNERDKERDEERERQRQRERDRLREEAERRREETERLRRRFDIRSEESDTKDESGRTTKRRNRRDSYIEPLSGPGSSTRSLLEPPPEFATGLGREKDRNKDLDLGRERERERQRLLAQQMERLRESEHGQLEPQEETRRLERLRKRFDTRGEESDLRSSSASPTVRRSRRDSYVEPKGHSRPRSPQPPPMPPRDSYIEPQGQSRPRSPQPPPMPPRDIFIETQGYIRPRSPRRPPTPTRPFRPFPGPDAPPSRASPESPGARPPLQSPVIRVDFMESDSDYVADRGGRS